MNILPINKAPAVIQAAFAEVQAVFPDLATVSYGDDMRWTYTLQSGEQPAFPEGLLNTTILEAGADALTSTPVTYTADNMNKTFENCTLLDTYTWVVKARPNVTEKDRQSQLGVHLEEVVEMLDQMTGNAAAVEAIMSARRALNNLAEMVKAQKADIKILNHELFLDSLCDQNVTGCGVAYTYGYDFVGAMTEVNRSNFSKFDADGKPIHNEHGKVMKGPNYSVAVLSPYLARPTS